MQNKRKNGPSNRAYLEDSVVNEWYTTLHLRSERTAKGYLQAMARVWSAAGLTPAEFAQGEQVDLDRLGQRVLNLMQSRPKPDGSRVSEGALKVYRTAMSSWLAWHGKAFQRRPVIGRAPKRPRASKQFIPTRQQLRAVLDAADTRTRASIALLAFSGLRPAVQGSVEGDRGLRLGNVEGLDLDGGRVEVAGLPLRLVVDEELSKNGRPFFSLLGAEGADYLVAYLNERIRNGERLTPESPLMGRRKHERRARKPFLVTEVVTKNIRAAHKTAGLSLPPYIWRSYFDANLMLAESKGCIIRDYRQFLMGHAGDIEAVYTVRKRLPEETAMDMAERYTASLRFLETRGDGTGRGGEESTSIAILRGLGCTEDEMAALDFGEPDAKQIEALVEEKVARLGGGAVAGPAGPRQRLVAVDAVAAWLERGWSWAYAAPVPEGMALVEAPSQTPSGTVLSPADAPVAA